jgi:hypothetical protein
VKSIAVSRISNTAVASPSVVVVRVGRIVAIDRQPFRCAVAEHTQQRGFVRHVDARQQRIDAPPTVAGRSRA